MAEDDNKGSIISGIIWMFSPLLHCSQIYSTRLLNPSACSRWWFRSYLKNKYHVRGQGAGRRKNAAYTV